MSLSNQSVQKANSPQASEKKHLLVTLRKDPNTLNLTVSAVYENRIVHIRQLNLGFLAHNINGANSFLTYWVFNSVRPLRELLDNAKIQLDVDDHVDEIVKAAAFNCLQMMQDTGMKIEKLLSMPITDEYRDKANAGILMLNVDDNWAGEALYRSLKASHEAVFYKPCFSGWDKSERVWKEGSWFDSLEDLFLFILTNRISKIVTLNNYFLQYYYQKHNVCLIDMFEKLGVEIVTYDLDPFDMTLAGIQVKKFFSGNLVYRQTLHVQDKEMDLSQGIQSVVYTIFPYGEEAAFKPFRPLKGKPSIKVLSNMRLGSILGNLPQLFWLFERLDPENLCIDYHYWFFSLRTILMQSGGLDEFSAAYLNAQIQQLAYTFSQFLKILVIDELIDSYDVKIYGNDEWSNVFPSEFQNTYARGELKSQILNEPNAMVLALGWSDSWVTNGTLSQYWREGIPFVSLPPASETPEFSALSALSFRSPTDLKIKLEKGIDWCDPELAKASKLYYDLCKEGASERTQLILNASAETYRDRYQGVYGAQMKAHEKVLNNNIQAFVDRNETVIVDSLDWLKPENQLRGEFTLKTSTVSSPLYSRMLSLLEKKNKAVSSVH